MSSEMTKDWELYEAGKNYNNKLTPNYYDTVDANLAFFQGDQWRNLSDTNMPKPVFNIIKRVITFFVASMTTSKIKANYETLGFADDLPYNAMVDPIEVANAQTELLFDKFKMEFKTREALFDAAITADAAAHFYFDVNKRAYNGGEGVQGEICMELVDGSNVFFGNANNSNVSVQPYIIISGRDMVKNLQEEAKQYKAQQQEIDNITSDVDYGEQSGDAGKIEVEADEYGKALYIIIYRYDKKTKTVKASKSVKGAYIYKDVDTGLSHYPIAWLNWEKQKNQYHGRAMATGLLPNQIFINRMFAMVMYHLMMTAFPKPVYNADYISSWNNEIAGAIPLSGLGLDANIRNVAGYLDTPNLSPSITNAIELVMSYTKETLGVSDAALGQIDPKNTSAIIAVQKSSAIPLENPKANLYEWIEDIGRILLDMMGTYYGLRPIATNVEVVLPDGKKEKQKKIQQFDFSTFKNMWLDVKADVGEASYWSEIASVQTLDRMLEGGFIDIVDYLERIPDEYIPQKQELIQAIQARMQQQAQAQQQGSVDQALQYLSPEEQQAFMSASPEMQQQMLAQIQG